MRAAQTAPPWNAAEAQERRLEVTFKPEMGGNQVTLQLERRSGWKACLLGEVPGGIWDEGGPAVDVGAADEGEIWTA